MRRSLRPALRATLLASLALASVPLHAQGSPRKPLPDYLPLPPGFALFNGGGRDWVVERGHEHFDYQPSPRQSTVYTAADGHAWLLVARATPAPASRLDQAAVNAQIRPPAGGAGLDASPGDALDHRPAGESRADFLGEAAG
jgi:hypothetical protein